MNSFGNINLLVAYYDRAADPALGAIGVVNLGVSLPPYSTPFAFSVRSVTAITSAANTATLSFGTIQTGVSSPTSLPTLLMNANVVTNFATGGIPQGGNSLFGNFSRFDTEGRDIIMTIAVQPLLTGSLVATIYYIKTNI